MDEDRMKKALDTLDSIVRSTREAREIARGLQQHQDNMVIWIVGLASGAVIGLPAMYNYILDLKSIPRWVLGVPIGLFVATVITGVLLRLLLANLMQKDATFAHVKIHGLELLRIQQFEGEEGRQQILRSSLAYVHDSDPTISQLKVKVDKITRYGGKLELLPYVFFALGVISAGFFAVCPPLK